MSMKWSGGDFRRQRWGITSPAIKQQNDPENSVLSFFITNISNILTSNGWRWEQSTARWEYWHTVMWKSFQYHHKSDFPWTFTHKSSLLDPFLFWLLISHSTHKLCTFQLLVELVIKKKTVNYCLSTACALGAGPTAPFPPPCSLISKAACMMVQKGQKQLHRISLMKEPSIPYFTRIFSRIMESVITPTPHNVKHPYSMQFSPIASAFFPVV